MNDRLRELLRETVKCIGDNMDVAGTEWQDAPMKTWMQKWEAALASQPSAEGTSLWQCEDCTYLNYNSYARCVNCGSAQPYRILVVAPPGDPKKVSVKDLINDIAQVLNKHSRENGSNTPDFLLAEYLIRCLKAFDLTSRAREKWYGQELHFGGAALASQPSAEMVFTEQEQRLIDTGKRTKDSFFSCVAESASGPKETSVETIFTGADLASGPDRCFITCPSCQEAIEVPASDLRAKLEALRDWMGEQMKGRPWTAGSHFDEAHKRLTAIIEGKD